MRESERKTYTVVWVVVTVVAGLALLALGSPLPALALVVVAVIGLVVFLRVTHPSGDDKPPIGILFDEPTPTAAATPTTERPAPPAAPVVDLRDDADGPDGPLAERRGDRAAEPVSVAAPAGGEPSLSAKEDAALAHSRASSVDSGDGHVELLQKLQSKLAQYD